MMIPAAPGTFALYENPDEKRDLVPIRVVAWKTDARGDGALGAVALVFADDALGPASEVVVGGSRAAFRGIIFDVDEYRARLDAHQAECSRAEMEEEAASARALAEEVSKRIETRVSERAARALEVLVPAPHNLSDDALRLFAKAADVVLVEDRARHLAPMKKMRDGGAT